MNPVYLPPQLTNFSVNFSVEQHLSNRVHRNTPYTYTSPYTAPLTTKHIWQAPLLTSTWHRESTIHTWQSYPFAPVLSICSGPMAAVSLGSGLRPLPPPCPAGQNSLPTFFRPTNFVLKFDLKRQRMFLRNPCGARVPQKKGEGKEALLVLALLASPPTCLFLATLLFYF